MKSPKHLVFTPHTQVTPEQLHEALVAFAASATRMAAAMHQAAGNMRTSFEAANARRAQQAVATLRPHA